MDKSLDVIKLVSTKEHAHMTVFMFEWEGIFEARYEFFREARRHELWIRFTEWSRREDAEWAYGAVERLAAREIERLGM